MELLEAKNNKIMKQTLEDYLEELYVGDIDEGGEDGMEERFDTWMSELDVQEVLDYAQEWHNKIIAEIRKEVDKII